MANNKITINENLVVLSDNEIDFDEKAIKLFESQKIDGIFAVDEISSVFAHKHGLKNDYKIPENLSIIGFADGVWARRLSPSLSTISQHGPEIGEVAANLLIERLESKVEDYLSRTKIIKTELRYRESTKKL